MAFIKLRNLKRDDAGKYVSGTAAIVDITYDANRAGHSKQTVRERLGKVAWIRPDRKQGIFLSPVRGLVFYDVETDEFEDVATDDPRMSDCGWIPPVQSHTNFGDVYLLLTSLENSGFLGVLRKVFERREDFERLLAHVLHGFLRDGSSIKCSTYIEQSSVSFILPHLVFSNLACDYRYFELMGRSSTQAAFFKALVEWMRQTETDFGRACYVDSTPLPSEAKNNPYVHLRTERGVTMTEMRMAMILDDKSAIPVWYTIFPGNLMDVNTLQNVVEDVHATLDVEINSLILDAGYASKDLIQTYIGGDSGKGTKHVILRMPHRKGYPYKLLYHKLRKQFDQPKYIFVRQNSVYYGRRWPVTLFGVDLFAYIYVDKYRALDGYREFMKRYPEQYEGLKDSERKWLSVHAGYFVLLSNQETEAVEMLERYISRTQIEAVFKSSKSFEGLMPLAKWNELTVRGKILQDVIETIIRSLLLSVTKGRKGSLADMFHDAASVAAFAEHNDTLRIETPNKQAKLAFRELGIRIPSTLRIGDWTERIFPG